jgi:hypothetical protein
MPVFLIRWEEPLRVMTWAWWTMRSIIAAASSGGSVEVRRSGVFGLFGVERG